MRIIFAGTPETAIPSLLRLADDHEIIAVLTRAPAPVGRKQTLTKSPVHVAAEEMGIEVLTPRTLRDPEIQAAIDNLAPDAVAVVAYGLIIPPELLDVPTHGWINLHYSLLPRWRGAAPVQHAIAAGDQVTGTATFLIEEGLDTGPVFDLQEHSIDNRTAGELLTALSDSGAEQLAQTFRELETGTATATPQSGEPTHAPQLSSKMAKIDWNLPAASIDAIIRGFTPEPGPWTNLDGLRVKVGPVVVTEESGLEPGEIQGGKRVLVGTGTTAVELTDVAPAGKRHMRAIDWLRGIKNDAPRFEVEA